MKSVHFRRAFILSTLLLLGLGAWVVRADVAPPAAAPRFQEFRIGNLVAIALEDGAIREPNDGKSFVTGQPPAKVAAMLKSGGAPTDHFEFSIQPLLVRAGNRVLLFDTGAGSNFGTIAGKLPQSLAAAGVNPANVTDIFISHAHGDHIGGLISSAGVLAFPNATIHISAPEWKWLTEMSAENAKNVGIEQKAALVTAVLPKVVTFEPGAEIFPNIVKAVEIRGHTPGHSGYLIGSGADTLFFIGDAMHSYVVSVRRPSWKIAFDTDEDTGAASRAALVTREASTGQRIYAGHFPFPGLGKVVREKTGYVWVPESRPQP